MYIYIHIYIYTHTYPVGLLWTSDQLAATNTTHNAQRHNKRNRRTPMPSAGININTDFRGIQRVRQKVCVFGSNAVAYLRVTSVFFVALCVVLGIRLKARRLGNA